MHTDLKVPQVHLQLLLNIEIETSSNCYLTDAEVYRFKILSEQIRS